MPSHFRDDYTSNMNDSFWLSNPEDPLTGFAQIIGDEETPRALRTRLGLKIIEQRLDGTDGLGGPNRFTRQQLQDAVFNNRQYAGELFRDELVALCENAPGGELDGDGGPVDVSGACPVLAAWDLHDDLDSNGAILFRRFASNLLGNPGGLPVGLPLPTGDPSVYTTPFDVNDPVNTPNGLNETKGERGAGRRGRPTSRTPAIPLDAPLRGWQYEKRGDERIPIHGGPGTLGVFNAINVGWSPGGAEPGYPNVPHGSSFVMVTSFRGDGGPCSVDDRSILTFSQSENPNSPHFADQTRMFSNKEWVNPPFCESEVLAEPGLVTETVTGPGNAARKCTKKRRRRRSAKASAASARRKKNKKKR